ncbi:MAG TPA: OB-fold nucleic acid binding domain-containing protein, partial [Magnetospirillaceae bacterium]|nr:OB-fold nucleic acid binding domain-containing protein [Magnetospirillaceae bacterium]
NNLEKVEYAHPLMENSLKNTFGVLVYQEQFMQISREVCGFTGGESDTLRKGVGKKKRDILEKMEVKFIEGAVKNGVPKQVIEKFWKDLLGFADYCFNKSHSACYGMTSYWTAYLKAHYPAAFMAALMTSDQGDTDRLAIEISECNHMGLRVMNPDVNQSFAEFAVVPDSNQIRFGLNAVKNVGANAVEEILRVREEGEFKSLEDFLKRVNIRVVNRKNMESLLKAGAFDSFGDRSDLIFNIDTILAYASRVQKDAAAGQTDLFGNLMQDMIPPLALEPAPTKQTERELLQWERELLGLYLSAHPLDKYNAYFSEQTAPIENLNNTMDNKTATVGGIVLESRVINTKNGSKMAFVKMEDKTGELEIIVFPKTFEEVGERLVQDEVIKVRGKINCKDRDGKLTEEVKIIADDITFVTEQELDNYKATGKAMKLPKPGKSLAAEAGRAPTVSVTYKPIDDREVTKPVTEAKPRLYIHVKNPSDRDSLVKLKQSFNSYPGTCEVVLVLGEDKKSAVRMPFTVEPHDDLKAVIGSMLGQECVALK